jgi:hypothetical protein
MSNTGWIGVDLDGTLAYYDKWRGIGHIGEPIPLMAQRVKNWISQGREVKIFTARVSVSEPELSEVLYHIHEWTKRHFGQVIQVTNYKDFAMIELWDDRCIQVQSNTGLIQICKWSE